MPLELKRALMEFSTSHDLFPTVAFASFFCLCLHVLAGQGVIASTAQPHAPPPALAPAPAPDPSLSLPPLPLPYTSIPHPPPKSLARSPVPHLHSPPPRPLPVSVNVSSNHTHKLSTTHLRRLGKALGIAFVSVAGLLQAVLVVFLFVRRSQLLKLVRTDHPVGENVA